MADLLTFTLGRMAFFATGNSSARFNTSGIGVAGIGIADRTGSVNRVTFRWQSKTGTPGVIRWGIEGLTATRSPDGTYKGGGSPVQVDWDAGAIAASGVATLTFDNAWSATTGDLFAVTGRILSGTFDGSNLVDIVALAAGVFGSSNVHTPSGWGLSGGTWSDTLLSGNHGAPSICPLYTDDAPVRGFAGMFGVTNDATWNSGSTSALYRGIKIIPAVTMQLRGAWGWFRPQTGTPNSITELHVFDGSNNELVATVPKIDASLNTVANNNALIYLPCTPTTLSSGSTYRIVLKPTTTTNLSQINRFDFLTSAIRQSVVGDVSSTVGSSTFTWTDSTTANFWPILPEFDVITAGGVIVVED